MEIPKFSELKVDGRTRQMNTVIGDALSENYGRYLLDTYIPEQCVGKSPSRWGVSISNGEASQGVSAYAALATEVKGSTSSTVAATL